jgi:hypothetical protein
MLSTVVAVDAAERLPRIAGSQVEVSVLYDDANKRYDDNVVVEVGGVHVSVMVLSVRAVATGARAAAVGAYVVAVNTCDATDSPIALSAVTLNEYAELEDRPLTANVVADNAARVTTQFTFALASPAVRSVVKEMTRPATDATVSELPFGVASHVRVVHVPEAAMHAAEVAEPGTEQYPVASANCNVCPVAMVASTSARVIELAVPESIEATSAPAIASTRG